MSNSKQNRNSQYMLFDMAVYYQNPTVHQIVHSCNNRRDTGILEKENEKSFNNNKFE